MNGLLKAFRALGNLTRGSKQKVGPVVNSASAPEPGHVTRVHSSKLLNLGCGAHFHADWVNVDITAHDPQVIQHDVQKKLPFEDVSFTAVYQSHVLEHLPRHRAPDFIQECHRVLASGGILRVVVPDLEAIARLYVKYLDAALAGDEDSAMRHEWMTLELVDQMVREESGGEMLKYWRQNPMPVEDFVIERTGQEVRKILEIIRASPPVPEPPTGKSRPSPDPAQISRFRESGEIHKWMYDRLSLRTLLEKCGFSDVSVCAATESRIPNFESYALDTTEAHSIRKPDSLFMEAQKP